MARSPRRTYGRSLPHPTIPEATLAQLEEAKGAALARLLTDEAKNRADARAEILDALTNGRQAFSHMVANLWIASATMHALHPLLNARDEPVAERVRIAGEVAAAMERDALMSARGLSGSGDLNTTSATGRAQAACEVAARAQLARTLRTILGETTI